jgi:hypothetical protein
MKRSDLTTYEVLSAVQKLGQTFGYCHLVEKYPVKIVDAAFEREVGLGRLNYGVSLRTAWIEPAGVAWLDANVLV